MSATIPGGGPGRIVHPLSRQLFLKRCFVLKALYNMKSIPGKKLDDAIHRLGMIYECEKEAAAIMQTGGKRTEALTVYMERNGISLATLYRWIKGYKEYGIKGLVDTRGGNNCRKGSVRRKGKANLRRRSR